MKWTSQIIREKSLPEDYRKKYGPESDYQKAQKILYSNPDIKRSLKQALKWMRFSPGDHLLDIGVNNGYELKFIQKKIGKKPFKNLNIIVCDLIEDSLKDAADTYKDYPKIRFIKGDIRKFQGKDVVSGKRRRIRNNSIDIIVAITSISSTSLRKGIKRFVKDLNEKLKRESQLLIAIPNCHTTARGRVRRGVWDPKKRSADYAFASALSEKVIKEFSHYRFSVKRIGTNFWFYYFYRWNTKTETASR